jgi:hypothetical protein
MGPPYAIEVTIPASTDFDPEDPSSATLHAEKPLAGESVSWAAAISAQDANSITVRKVLATSDLDQEGKWFVWVSFETPTPGDLLRTEVFAIDVLGAAELSP